jgi:hypothetical protein
MKKTSNKICSICGQEKPRSEFNTRKGSPDGLRTDCKACIAARGKAWRAANPDKKTATDRDWYERNREKAVAYAAAKYLENLEENRAKRRSWHHADLEKHRAASRMRRILKGDIVRADRRRHYQENKPIYKAAARARNKYVRQATPPWADLKAIEALYAQAEAVTAQTGVPHHVDHFYPLRSKTMCGLHVPWNLRIIPDAVNVRKGNAIPDLAASPLCCAWPQVYSF